MADKDLTQGQQLAPSDKTRYIEIASGVYCQGMGAYLMGTPESGSPVEVATFAEHASIHGHGL